jgi:peptide/nickel transport system permease protein
MRQMILRKCVVTCFVLWGVATLVFLFIHLIPGDPVEIMLGETALAADKQALRAQLGLDKPFLEQYANFLQGLCRGSLGRSIHERKPVAELILARYPATVQLAIAAMAVSLLIAVPTGVASALRQYSAVDTVSMFLAMIGVSMPNFLLGPLLIMVFSLSLGWFPIGGKGGLEYLVLPAITLGSGMSAIVARMTRSSVLEVLREEYVTTARAKGLSEAAVIFKHVLRNALLPVVTVVGLQCGALLAGSIITETIFSWPGIGRLLVEGIQSRDYPVVQGCVLVIAFSYVLVNTLTDLLYAIIDPRVRYGGGQG